MDTMKAVVYTKASKPNKLVYCDVEKPVPADNELLIKVNAVAVNAADYRSMNMGMIPKKKIFGADIAGRVVEVGTNCHQFKAADGTIKPVFDRYYSLAEGPEAVQYTSEGHASGKVIITCP